MGTWPRIVWYGLLVLATIPPWVACCLGRLEAEAPLALTGLVVSVLVGGKVARLKLGRVSLELQGRQQTPPPADSTGSNGS